MIEEENNYVMRAIRHYHSLFTFPSHRMLVALLLLISVGGSIIAFSIIFQSFEGLRVGLLFGATVLALPSIIGDVILRGTIIRKNEIFDLRRSIALSTLSCALWITILLIGGFFQVVSRHNTLFYASILGSCAVTALRYLALFSISSLDKWRVFVSTMIQPLFCLVANVVFCELKIWESWPPSAFLAVLIANFTLLIATHTFIHLIDRYGRNAIGIGSIDLLKGFAASWIKNIPFSLEASFEKLGHDTDTSVALIAFRDKEGIRAIMTVPAIHPGPFRNLGSSNLPYMVQKSLEKKFGCTAATPHGTTGHGLNLTSQHQCMKALREIINLAEFSRFSTTATVLVRREAGSATATCQFFGKNAVVTATCAPKSMEDIPPEVGFQIAKKGAELGARTVVVIDAHNSIEASDKAPMLSERDLKDIQEAANSAIATALNESQTTFQVGIAKVIPQDFNPTQGMGYGGIVAFTIMAGEQTVAYVIIDGNNMVSGFRDEILEALKRFGVEDGEVLTTDTHVVNALTLVERGYHPVGEALDKERLIFYIEEAVCKALTRMRRSETSFNVGKVYGVKVIGEEAIDKLSLLVDSTLHIAKRYALIVFAPVTLLIVLLSLLLFV